MVPDDDYLRKEEAGEKERLAKKVAALSDSDRQKIVARGELIAALPAQFFPLAEDHHLGEEIKDHLVLGTSQGGHPELPIPNSPYGSLWM